MKLRWYQEEAVKAMEAATNNSVVVLPTGSGKTLTMSSFINRRKGNVLVLSHVKEILEQNARSLGGVVNKIGIYSASMGIRHIDRVTVAGIQSVYRNMSLFKQFDTIIVDEAHMVNDTGMYHEVMNELDAQTFGLTATPFRLKEGFIHGNDGMFDSKCYEAPIDKLIEDGFLCPLKTIGAKDEEFDTNSIRTTGGDFNVGDLGLAFNRTEITKRIVQRLLDYKEDYKHWLLFAIDIQHAEQIAKYLNMAGITAEAVHSKSPRDKAIEHFKLGKIQALVNVNILTVGFDYPQVDFIVMLRPTKSPVLHMQALGRGMRVHLSKKFCLVKDFAGNLKRLGSVTNVKLTAEGKPKKGGKNPFMKECPDCERIVHPAVRVCKCGHKFKFRHGLQVNPDKGEPEWFEVTKITYNIASTKSGINGLLVTYRSNLQTFREWVLLDHPGYAGYKAKYWLANRWRSNKPQITNVKELYKQRDLLWIPEKVQVDLSGKYHCCPINWR